MVCEDSWTFEHIQNEKKENSYEFLCMDNFTGSQNQEHRKWCIAMHNCLKCNLSLLNNNFVIKLFLEFQQIEFFYLTKHRHLFVIKGISCTTVCNYWKAEWKSRHFQHIVLEIMGRKENITLNIPSENQWLLQVVMFSGTALLMLFRI